MADKKKLVEGDIFYVYVNGKYIFGKILVDIKSRILKKEPKHEYWFYGKCFLVEIYKGLYDEPKLITPEVIMPSSFVYRNCFNGRTEKDVDWVYYDHQVIDYKKLDFPETLETGENGFLNFRKFDISIPTKTRYHDFWPDPFNQKYNNAINLSYYTLVDDALHLQDRDDLLVVKNRKEFIKDLRLQIDDRISFYKQIKENIKTSYYEMALKHGFDLGRFYE
jgi:hypothetical protein